MDATIRSRFDADAGLHVVDVFIEGEWYEVSTNCEKEQAECVVKILNQWKSEQ